MKRWLILIVCVVSAVGLTLNLLVGEVVEVAQRPNIPDHAQVATFAGGCFWCMEPPFQKASGVLTTVVGYANGTGENPTYQDYAQKGYVEAVQVTFDPTIISYKQLLDIFWHNINPTDAGGQFVDRGAQYRAAIFCHNDEQRTLAQESKDALAASGKFTQPIVTEIAAAINFFPAEEYHQDYHTKNPIRYNHYRYNAGRDAFLTAAWGKKPDTEKKLLDEELRKKLTPLQYTVTQRNGTEPAFDNAYWNNEKPGIYVDLISGEPLFSSRDKFDSGTGWPSFTKPLEPNNIVEKEDKGWFGSRTEIRSRKGNAHLGHVFKDGPPPTGLRYCMNSAALRFVPAQDLEKEGFGQYTKLFLN